MCVYVCVYVCVCACVCATRECACVLDVNDHLPGLEEVLTLEVEWRDRPHSLRNCLEG